VSANDEIDSSGSCSGGARPWRRLLRCVLLLAAVAAGSAGCGGGSSSHSATVTTGTKSPNAALGGEPRPTPTVVAEIPFAANLTFDRHGGLWVGSGAGGAATTDGVWYVPAGGQPRQVIKGLHLPFGLAWEGERLYVGHAVTPSRGSVTVFEGFDGRRFTRHHDVLQDLPIGEHSVGTIAPGPQGRLFVGVGAPHDHTGPPGHILSLAPDGSGVVLEATGLRSAFGLAFQGPRLLVTDNGPDVRGRTRSSDELDAFDVQGPPVNFGFPRCYNQGGSACAGTRAPFVIFAPHAAPAGVAVTDSVAYVSENGSASSRNPTGNAVVRVDLRKGEQNVFWRSPVEHDPSGAVIGPDGNLYVALYVSGRVVRFRL
jgi:glucose/arabinose dehydrogenase